MENLWRKGRTLGEGDKFLTNGGFPRDRDKILRQGGRILSEGGQYVFSEGVEFPKNEQIPYQKSRILNGAWNSQRKGE